MRSLLCILIVLLLTACGNKINSKFIAQADSLLEGRPDSAYAILKKNYHATASLSKNQRMLYLLIYAEAMNKAYIPMDTINFMDDVLKYYNSHGDNHEKMIANYMMGCVFRDKGNSPEALRFYDIAVSVADTTDSKCDFLLLSRIYGQMASVYMEQRYPSKELGCWRKGSKFALLGCDTLSAIQYLEKSGSAYLLNGDRESYMICIDSAINEYMRHGHPQYAAACQIHKAHLFLDAGNIDEAGKTLRIFREKSGLFNAGGSIQPGHELYYYYEGIYLERSGHLEDALGRFYKLLQYKGDIQNVENAYKGLMDTYRDLRNVDSLSKYSKLYAQANDSANIMNSASELIRMQSLYNYNESQQNLMKKTKESKSLWRTLFFFFVVVLIMSSIIILYLKKRKKTAKKIEEGYKSTLDLLRKSEAELYDMQNDLEMFKKQKQEEVEHLKQLLSSYCENFRTHEWASEQSVLHHGTVEHLRKLARRGMSMSASEWDDFEKTIKKIMREFYEKIEGLKVKLTDQEYKVCLLTRLEFSSTDISNLLGTSQQRVTNIKSSINAKLFHQKGSKSLSANLSTL